MKKIHYRNNPINKITGMVFLTLFLFVAGTGLQTFAQEIPPVETIWENISKSNPDLMDYQAPISIKVNGKYQFLHPKLDLTGTYYFKKPDKHKLKLDRASYFLNKYPQIFGWNLPPLKEFNASVEIKSQDSKDFYVVTLTPKTIAGDIEKEIIWVDKENFTFPVHLYKYKKGGEIRLEIKYKEVDQYHLFDTMNASFNFPAENLTANANAVYGTYKINQGLSDDFFKEK